MSVFFHHRKLFSLHWEKSRYDVRNLNIRYRKWISCFAFRCFSNIHWKWNVSIQIVEFDVELNRWYRKKIFSFDYHRQMTVTMNSYCRRENLSDFHCLRMLSQFEKKRYLRRLAAINKSLLSSKNTEMYSRNMKCVNCRFDAMSQYMQIAHVIKNNSQYHFNVCMKCNVKLSENTKDEIFARFIRSLIIWNNNMLVKVFLNHYFCEIRNRSSKISFLLNNVLRLNSVMLMKSKWERFVNEFRNDFSVYFDIIIIFSDNKAQIVYFTYFECHDY